MNAPTATGHKVLIIEDSRVQSKIISKQIELLTSFETRKASTLKQAREILEQEKGAFFISVVDLNLEDAPDGEAVDLVISHGVPAIVLTAYINDQLRSTFLEKKVVDYFFKGSVRDMDPMVSSLERIYKNRWIKAMVVDDSRMERALMEDLLSIQNFQVVTAVDGVEALEILEDNPEIRLIITDYQMPRMDGVEFVKAVREKHKKDKIAVIGVSAAGSGAMSALFLKNGANDFLTKPFEAEEFYWRANQCVDMLEIVERLKEHDQE